MTEPSTFDSYCTTSMLPTGADPTWALEWRRRYFTFHYHRFLPSDYDAAIADVGCGWGAYLAVLRDLGYTNLRGVDAGEGQVAHARDQLGLSDVVERGEAMEWLEGRPGQFDCILVFDLLEHLDLADLLRLGHALTNALRPHGRVIVQVPNGMSPLNPIRYADITHRRSFTVASLRQFFAFAGLEPRAFVELGQFPHGAASRVQRLLWRGVFSPLLRLFVYTVHGKVDGKIFTINIGAVAELPR